MLILKLFWGYFRDNQIDLYIVNKDFPLPTDTLINKFLSSRRYIIFIYFPDILDNVAINSTPFKIITIKLYFIFNINNIPFSNLIGESHLVIQLHQQL